jgi:hypothetical protein
VELKGSLLCSQQLTSCAYREPDGSSTHPYIALRSILILSFSFYLCLCLPSGCVPSGLPIKPLYAFQPPPPPHTVHMPCLHGLNTEYYPELFESSPHDYTFLISSLILSPYIYL